MALEVAGEAAVSADPSKGSLDDPSFGHDDEAMSIASLDDLQHPATFGCNSLSCFLGLVAGVGEDALDEWKQRPRALVDHEVRAVAILDIGGMNSDAQQEAERIDQDVPLAALDLLARVVA